MLELPIFHNLNTFDSNQQLATNCSSLLFNDGSITNDVSMQHILEACNLIKSYVRITK